MNALDAVVLVIIGISGLMSFRVGIIREAFALAALLIGLLAAVVLGRAYADQVPDLLHNEAATEILFFLLCFVVFYLIVWILGSIIAKVIKSIQLSWLDHLLGFAFGALRGAIVALLVMAALTLVVPVGHPLLTHSEAYRIADRPMRVLSQLLPEKAEEVLEHRHEIYRRLIPAERDKKKGRKSTIKGSGVPLAF